MIEKKVSLANMASQYKEASVTSSKPLLALFLALAAGGLGVYGMKVIVVSSERGLAALLVAAVCFIWSTMVQGNITRFLIFLEKGHYLNDLTIREEIVGEDEARARLVELAHAMQEVSEYQVENRKAMKTVSDPVSRQREDHHRVDERLSGDFKKLQTRFYDLLRALVAQGYAFNPDAKFTDFLFPREHQEPFVSNKA